MNKLMINTDKETLKLTYFNKTISYISM